MKNQFLKLAPEILCPPGRGVYTVHTAADKKILLDQLLYGVSGGSEDLIRNKWLSQLEGLSEHDGVALIGVCSDTGGGIQRGANWGPLMVRVALAENKRFKNCLDLGDVRIVPHLLSDKYLNPETLASVREALYDNPESDLPVSPLSLTELAVGEFLAAHAKTPLLALGGDHSVSYALCAPFIKARQARGKKVGLLHFDAHTDLMTKRLGIDFCFASWVPPILKLLPNGAHCAQVGIRSTGRKQEHWENTFGLKQYWSSSVKEQGAQVIAAQITAQFKAQNIEELYISFDIDALDQSFAAATGTPETAGLAPHECLIIMQELEKEFAITGADLVEVAPFVHFPGEHMAMEQTLESAQIIAGHLLEALQRSRGK